MSLSYFRDVLPSGLRVVTVCTPHLHSAVVAAYVRAGSRHEHPENNGVSHFLEHMFFRGSRSFPDTVRMNAAVEDAGGNLNAVTTRDHGSYYTPLHPAHLDVGLNILGDMLTAPLLTKLEIEREIILEEMLDEVDEKGRDIDVDNLSKMRLYAGHPLALKIAGTPDSVRAMTLEKLTAHLDRFYVAQNMVVVAAGRVDRRQVLELAERAFAHLRQGERASEAPPTPLEGGPTLHFVTHTEAQTEFRLSFPAVPEHHADYPALQLLRRVLDDGLSSRLPFNVVETKGLAYSIQANLETFDDVGTFEIEGASAPNKASRVVDEVLRTLAELRERDVAEEELARAKRRHRMFLEFVEDSPGELAAWFGGTEVFRTPESFEQRARRLESTTAEQVRQAAYRYFTAANLHAVAVGQRRGAQALARSIQRASAVLAG